ncbi:mucin-12 [Ischnura elegans]|uniref:mucin-12 n=1 Tax=Ischnura elegans TaxID=197161 RepID=UPI001ED8B564|nr:mucin-12 [Ischnura elegans]
MELGLLHAVPLGIFKSSRRGRLTTNFSLLFATGGAAVDGGGVGGNAARWHHHHPSTFTEGGGLAGASGASVTAFVAMLGSSLQPPPPAPIPAPSTSSPAPSAPSPSSSGASSSSAAPGAASAPSPSGSPFHHAHHHTHHLPHPPHAHHHFGSAGHRAPGGLRVPWPPPASNHPPEAAFGRFGGGLYSLFPAPAPANSPSAEVAVYSPSPSPSSPANSPAAGSPFASADHYHSFIAAQKESLFSSAFSFNGGAGSLVGAGLQAHFSSPHVGLLAPATALDRGITNLEMLAAKKRYDKPPSSVDANNSDGKMALARDSKDHNHHRQHQQQQQQQQQSQQRRTGTSAQQHWPEVRFIMPKSENGPHSQQPSPCGHESLPSPVDHHVANSRRRGSKRRWPEGDVPEVNSAKLEARSACACHRATATTTTTTTTSSTTSSSTSTTILTIPTSIPSSQGYQPRMVGALSLANYHVPKLDLPCKRNGSDPSPNSELRHASREDAGSRGKLAGSFEADEEQKKSSGGGCSRTTPVSLRCPRDSSTPTAAHARPGSSGTPQSPLAMHHAHQQQMPLAQGASPGMHGQVDQWNGGSGGLLQLQVTVKKERGSEGSGSAGTTPCQVAEVTTSRNSAEGSTPASAFSEVPSSEPHPIAALSQMPLLCMSPNALLLKSIKVEEGPTPPSPGVLSPTTTTPLGCAAAPKECGRQSPVSKRHQQQPHPPKAKKEAAPAMPPYPQVPLSSASCSVPQSALGGVVSRQQRLEAAPRLAPLPPLAPVSQLDKRPEGGMLLVRGPAEHHPKGRHKGATDVSQTPSTPTLTVSAPSAMVAPACNAATADQLTATSIPASAIAAAPPSAAAVLQPAPCEEAAGGEVAAAVAAAVANGMHSWAPLHHSPALTPPHHLHHHHTLWLGQGQTFPAPVPLQLGASQATPATDAQHVPLPPVGYQLVRDPLTGQLLLIPTTNLAEHLQRAAAAAAVVWPSFPSALPPHASGTSPHLHQLMLQTQPPQQAPQQHILFPSSQQQQQAHTQAVEHHQAETEYRILFQHQIHQQQQQQQQHRQHQHHHQAHQSHQLQQPSQQSSEQQGAQSQPTLVIPGAVHDFVKKKEEGETAVAAALAPGGILIAVPKVEVVEPEDDETRPAAIAVDDVKPGIPSGFLHPHQQHLGHPRRGGAELLVPGVAVVSPAASVASGVATSASLPPYVFPAGAAVAATQVATASGVNSTPAVQFFYEHSGMVRMTQAQPSAAVQTESGRRSQGTSPVNPADTCLTPPPEAPCLTSEVPEDTVTPVASRGSNINNSAGAVDSAAATEATNSKLPQSSQSNSATLASNTTEPQQSSDVPSVRPEVRAESAEAEPSSAATPAAAAVPAQEMDEAAPPVQVQDAGNQTEMTMGSDDDSSAMLMNASSDETTSESTQHIPAFVATSADAMTSTDSQDAQCAPAPTTPKPPPRLVVIQPPLQSPVPQPPSEDAEKSKASEQSAKPTASSNEGSVDLSGLELLSNSIEQFESNRTPDMPLLEKNEVMPTRTSSEQGKSESKDENLTDELKVEEDSHESAPRLDKEASLDSISDGKTKVENTVSEPSKQEQSGDSSNSFSGGLGLLCALAEQRFMEEVAMTEPDSNHDSSWPKEEEDSKSPPSTTPASSSPTTRNSVDVHRNYKSPKSEREIKAFIASKVSQYQGQNSTTASPLQPFQYSQVQQNLFQSILSANAQGGLGSKAFGSSPFTSLALNGGSSSSVGGSSGICSSSFGSSPDVMDAMELDMRMRLAELQRKYREKQRELSRLQHSRTKATGDEATTASGAESCAVASSDNPSPTKRGPGRPRKQVGKKLATPSQLNSALSASRRGSSSSSGSSSCGGASPQKELSPPVLEKVTEVIGLRKRRRRRQRKTLRRHHKQKCGYSEDEDDDDEEETGDEEDGGADKGPADVAPRLRLASKDILKPPTLTANKIINCARFKPEETGEALSAESTAKAFKLPQCNVNLVKLKASTISGKVKASELSPALSKAGTSCDAKAKLGAGVEKLPNGSSLLVSASSASGASWLARNTQNNSYITTTTTTTTSPPTTTSTTTTTTTTATDNSDHNDKGGCMGSLDGSPFHYRNSLLNPCSAPAGAAAAPRKALLAPSSLRIPPPNPAAVPSVRKQSLSCYTFGSKQLTPSLLSSGEKQRLESLTSDSSMLWFLKPDSDASKEPAVGVGGFSPSQKAAEEKRAPPTSTTATALAETNVGNSSLVNGRKRKAISSASQLTEKQQQPSPHQTPLSTFPPSARSSTSSIISSSTTTSSSSATSSPSSSPAFRKRKPGRPKKHPNRAKAAADALAAAKKLKKKSVVGFVVGPPDPSEPTDAASRAPLATPAPSAITAPASPATASTPPCPSPCHKPKIKPKLKAEAKVKSSLSCDDEDDWIQLQPSIPSPVKGRRRAFEEAGASPAAAVATSPAGFPSATTTAAAASSRPAWTGGEGGGPPSLAWGANSSGTASTPAETSPSLQAAGSGSPAAPQPSIPRKKKLTTKGKIALAKKKAAALSSARAALANSAASAQAAAAEASGSTPGASGATADQSGAAGEQEQAAEATTGGAEKRRRSGERAATTSDLLHSLKKRQTRIQSAGGAVGAVGAAGNATLSGAAAAAKVTIRSRSFADNHESSSYSEGENVPLIALKERPATPAPRSCKITQEDLHDGLRALTSPDGGGLLYAGQINAIQAPDVYGITLDGERGHRPHIYSREEILKEAIAEVRPGSVKHLQPGTRVCAYWSQQYRCLYPGIVSAPSSPDPELDRRFVGVEFDDGDSGRININDIRLLPQDFPIVDYDPNPLMSLARRRRRASGASTSGVPADGVISKEKKDAPIPCNPTASEEATTSSAPTNCDSSLGVSKPKKRKKENEKDGDSTGDQELRKKSSYWKEMEKTMSASSTPVSNSGSAGGTSLAEADSSGLPMPGSKILSVTKKLTAAEKEKRRMRKREKARKRDKLRRQQLLAAKIAATAMNCDELSASSGIAANQLSADLSAMLKKKHKKHRSNKCDEKCMLVGKKHRHHHHHRKHHRHHHHKHRHHRRGSKHCTASSASGLPTTSGDNISSELSAESLLAESKVAISSPSKVLHAKRKKKKKKTLESKVKEGQTKVAEVTSVTDSMQANTSETSDAPSSAIEPQEAPAMETEAVGNNGDPSNKDESDEIPQAEISEETMAKKAGQKTSKKDGVSGSAPSKVNSAAPARKQRDRQPSVESRSKMAAFLPARQLWRWSGRGFKRPGAKGRGKKEFYKSIQRGKETIKVGDCAVFLSTGRPDRPYIGSIESMWESWGGNMVVRVKWFYHPEETKGGPSLEALKFPGALFQSPHIDENDVQTISHKCEVLAFGDYRKRMGDGGTGDEMEPSRYASVYDNNDVYYLAGHYDPTNAVLTMEADIAKS